MSTGVAVLALNAGIRRANVEEISYCHYRINGHTDYRNSRRYSLGCVTKSAFGRC